jgi:hypothetical protein
MRMNKPIFLAFLLMLTIPARLSWATQTGVEVQQITFGHIIITDNSASRSCVVAATGGESCDATGVLLLISGETAIYRLSGFDPNTALGAVIDNATPLSNSVDGTQLDIGSFTLNPPIDTNPQTPDTSGNLTLKIGATLSTRPGTTYAIAPYRGTYRLTITY